ncbi:YhjD/YihY/BrkB family envelope integrity protein [Kitasatospora sp. NPDC127111]|uniref:YhjD/YihY/BrkB family envelope integrity protein n=1 Tax=Kitasatospora sp. NPDC127111 TaxID=3345363 RepID=UPI003645DABB
MTFWLRPAFGLRVAKRFQAIAGFDRALALASAALTAAIPLAILCGTLLAGLGGSDVADRVVERYNLTGDGAEAVQEALAPSAATGTGGDVFSALFLLLSMLGFARAAQRLFEQTWELRPLSVRNTANGLWWILGLAVYTVAGGWLHAAVGSRRHEWAASLLVAPLTGAFLVWSGRVLSAKRITARDLVPFGVTAAAVTAVYSIGATVYLPRLFSSYADRYGAVGSVFAMLSALFGAMVAVVGSAALGREVHDELNRINRGERPPEDEVRREWHALVEQIRSRWRTVQEQRPRRRRPTEPRPPDEH